MQMTQSGWNALHFAANEGSVESLEMLVKRLKDLNAPLQEILGRQDTVRHNFPYSLSQPHSLTRMTTMVGGSVVPSLLFYSKETETERARARRTIRDSLARFHRLHLTLSLS